MPSAKKGDSQNPLLDFRNNSEAKTRNSVTAVKWRTVTSLEHRGWMEWLEESVNSSKIKCSEIFEKRTRLHAAGQNHAACAPPRSGERMVKRGREA